MTTTKSTAAPDSTTILRGLSSKKRVPLGSAVYNVLLETLYDEAAALDERRFDDWVAVWAAMNARGPVWGIERLRITPSPFHTDSDIDHLGQALHSLWQHCALARAVA